MNDDFDNSSFGDFDLDNADVKIRPEFYAHLVISALPKCWDGDVTVSEGNQKKEELISLLGSICKAAGYLKKLEKKDKFSFEELLEAVFDKKNIKGNL